MRAAVKFVFAAILAVLLLCAPVGLCWDSARAEHPCCPKKPAPLTEDCARLGCVYLDTHVAVDVAALLALRQRMALYRQLLI